MQRAFVLPLLTTLISSGCSDPPPAPDPVGDLAGETAPTPEPPPREHPPVRLGGVRGEVTVDGAAAAAGAEVRSGQMLRVAESAGVRLRLRGGGQLTLGAETIARVIDDGAGQLLLLRGTAHGSLPPSGEDTRPPLRVITPSVIAEIPRSGEVFVASFPNGASWTAALNGTVSVSVGDADGDRRLQSHDLSAGRCLAVVNRIDESIAGPGRLNDARAMARALAAEAGEPDLDRLTENYESELRRLDEALRWLEAETRRGQDLTRQHREAVRTDDTDESARLRRELVGHSRALYRLRLLAGARWERLQARNGHLEVVGRSPPEPPLEQRRERARGLLGLN